MKKLSLLLTVFLTATLLSSVAFVDVHADDSEENKVIIEVTDEVVSIDKNNITFDSGIIMPMGATAQYAFPWGTTKTTLTLRDSYNIPVKVEVWVERSSLTGARVTITKFKLLSYSGALISNVSTRLDTSKMNPGNGKTASATLYINYSISGVISGQTIFGLDVTTGGTGNYYVT